jgi:type 1 glutamine amidotransferase
MSVINYRAKLNVLVPVKGHPYQRDAFAALLDTIPDTACTIVEQPAAACLFDPALAQRFDAVLLYDMPGLDFSQKPPELMAPAPEFQRHLLELLERGMGFVFMHHAIAGWPTWPEYAEIVGGRFLYRPAVLRGRDCLDSGYRHAVRYRARAVAEHPVLAGVEREFELVDELYLGEVFDDSIQPLLVSDFDFNASQFYSAYRAVTGEPLSNRDWPHSPGSNTIAWVKHYRNSPIVYLQPGDGPDAYDNPNIRRLVANAVRWVASASARNWARAANGEKA